MLIHSQWDKASMFADLQINTKFQIQLKIVNILIKTIQRTVIIASVSSVEYPKSCRFCVLEMKQAFTKTTIPNQRVDHRAHGPRMINGFVFIIVSISDAE